LRKLIELFVGVAIAVLTTSVAWAAPNVGDDVETLISQAMDNDRAGQTLLAIEELKKNIGAS
jgi:hypothetical protein